MLTAYIAAAMQRAIYETLSDGLVYGEIPDLPGVMGTGETQETCRDDLQGALEAWIVVGLYEHHTLPALDSIDLRIEEEVPA